VGLSRSNYIVECIWTLYGIISVLFNRSSFREVDQVWPIPPWELMQVLTGRMTLRSSNQHWVDTKYWRIVVYQLTSPRAVRRHCGSKIAYHVMNLAGFQSLRFKATKDQRGHLQVASIYDNYSAHSRPTDNVYNMYQIMQQERQFTIYVKFGLRYNKS